MLLDAAELVLQRHSNRQPLTNHAVVTLVIEHGYWRTGGKTHANTLSARVNTEIEQRNVRGQPQRFMRPQRGLPGLVAREASRSKDAVEVVAAEDAHTPHHAEHSDVEALDDAPGAGASEEAPAAAGRDPAEADVAQDAEGPPVHHPFDLNELQAMYQRGPEIASAMADYRTTLKSTNLIRCLATYLETLGARYL